MADTPDLPPLDALLRRIDEYADEWNDGIVRPESRMRIADAIKDHAREAVRLAARASVPAGEDAAFEAFISGLPASVAANIRDSMGRDWVEGKGTESITRNAHRHGWNAARAAAPQPIAAAPPDDKDGFRQWWGVQARWNMRAAAPAAPTLPDEATGDKR